MNAPTTSINQQLGLIKKFNIARIDGRDLEGGDRAKADYFVLDLTHDIHAVPAIAAYAKACAPAYPLLAADLRAKISSTIASANEFVTVPESIVDGIVVPEFQVGKYLCSKSELDGPAVTADGTPWVRVSHGEANAICASAGMFMLTELQALAIAQNIVNQPINWTDDAVGKGKVYQGLHKGTVSGPQNGHYTSPLAIERRWHELSNGERIYDFAGHVFTWIFDNVQGDSSGVVEQAFTPASPSIRVAPYPSLKCGMGWQPSPTADWAGDALIRGGYWDDGDDAGVFHLDRTRPGNRNDSVGFRCTK